MMIYSGAIGSIMQCLSIAWILLILATDVLECTKQHTHRKAIEQQHSSHAHDHHEVIMEHGFMPPDSGADYTAYDGHSFESADTRPQHKQRKHHQPRRAGHRKKHRRAEDNDLSLWISEQQLQMLSALFFPQGYAQGRIYAIENGHVLNEIHDVSIYKYLAIPAEVNYVNFTWKSGHKKYFYHFDRLQTMDESILKAPTLSIKNKGRIPQEEKNFSIFLPCTGNNSGTAMFNVGLSIQNRRNKPLPGTPLRLSFKKECAHRGPDPHCRLKCGKNGFCNHNKVCQCKAGYTGVYCQTAFCFPQCMNGGNCTAPSVCTCPDGYQGTQCEGGICREKCLNGGKCVQKDKCQCPKGYYGLRCEYSKCVIPCKNGGRCVGNNLCRCPSGLGGHHCEIGRKQRSTCKRPCKHGICMPNKTCKCDDGFYGRFCNRRVKKHRHNR